MLDCTLRVAKTKSHAEFIQFRHCVSHNSMFNDVFTSHNKPKCFKSSHLFQSHTRWYDCQYSEGGVVMHIKKCFIKFLSQFKSKQNLLLFTGTKYKRTLPC